MLLARLVTGRYGADTGERNQAAAAAALDWTWLRRLIAAVFHGKKPAG